MLTYKLVSINKQDLPQLIKDQQAGPFPEEYWSNQLPKGFVEITEAEFAASEFFIWSFDYYIYDQCPLKKGDYTRGIRQFWLHDGSGFAILEENQKSIRYFRIGCHHQWQEQSLKSMREKYPQHVRKFTGGNCCHNEVCTKCQVYRFIDSSD